LDSDEDRQPAPDAPMYALEAREKALEAREKALEAREQALLKHQEDTQDREALLEKREEEYFQKMMALEDEKKALSQKTEVLMSEEKRLTEKAEALMEKKKQLLDEKNKHTKAVTQRYNMARTLKRNAITFKDMHDFNEKWKELNSKEKIILAKEEEMKNLKEGLSKKNEELTKARIAFHVKTVETFEELSKTAAKIEAVNHLLLAKSEFFQKHWSGTAPATKFDAQLLLDMYDKVRIQSVRNKRFRVHPDAFM